MVLQHTVHILHKNFNCEVSETTGDVIYLGLTTQLFLFVCIAFPNFLKSMRYQIKMTRVLYREANQNSKQKIIEMKNKACREAATNELNIPFPRFEIFHCYFMKVIVIVLFLLVYDELVAQNSNIDSLDRLIANATSDTQRINLINKKINVISDINLDSAIQMGLANIEESKKINYKSG